MAGRFVGVGHGTVAFAGLLAADAILLGGIRGSDAGARDDQPAPDLFSAGQPCRDDAGNPACHVTDGDAVLAAHFDPGRRRGRCVDRHDDYRNPRFRQATARRTTTQAASSPEQTLNRR